MHKNKSLKTPNGSGAGKPNNLHFLGHRKKVRSRFLDELAQGASSTLKDYELLEIMLFGANARIDTKPIAKRLLDRFGSLGQVINAPAHLLEQVEGIGEASIVSIKILNIAMSRVLYQKVTSLPILESWQDLENYYKNLLGFQTQESLRMLTLDNKNYVTRDLLMGTGTLNNISVNIRNIIKQALLHDAASVLLAHNHPTGDFNPSNEDIEAVQEIEDHLKSADLKLFDNLVVTKEKVFSFRLNGLL